METLLSRWLGGAPALSVLDEGSVALARERVRQVGEAQGVGRVEVEQMALVVSELAHNHLDHARAGAVAVQPLWRRGVPGLEVVAVDRGPGIANPTEALHGRTTGTGSLGAGVSCVLRQADEVDFDVRWGEGTCVRARKYAVPPPRRCEVGVLGRPCTGEPVSGDHAVWLWEEQALVAAVVDGLGHGWGARQAADLAVEEILRHSRLEPAQVLERCHTRLQGSRGAALATVRLEHAGRLHQACLGNVSTQVYALEGSRSLPCVPGVVGLHQRRVHLRPQELAVPETSLLVMYTDGLSMRTELTDPVLLRCHPLEVAHSLLHRFARDNDDALVLVARVR